MMICLHHTKKFMLCLAYFVALPSTGYTLQQIQSNNVNDVISNIFSTNEHAYVTQNNFVTYKKTVSDLYFVSPRPLLWLDLENVDNPKVAAVLQLISRANESGLNEAHYNLNALNLNWQRLKNQQVNEIYDLALFDTAISFNLLHFLSDLHYGRINPKTLNFNFDPSKSPLDLMPIILSAIEKNEISTLSNKVEPVFPTYHQLKKALAAYLTLKKKSNLTRLNYISSIRPDDNIPQVIAIRQKLNQLGMDLDKNNSASCHYDEHLSNKIKEFQTRHGLLNDGIIGKKTIKALNISIDERIRKIELALERLRWMPKKQSDTLITVNIPAFQLWAYNKNDTDGFEELKMRVIVGKSKRRKSPVFTADMYYIEFSPYWNIPKSITVEEILPKLLENAQYLEQQNMEIVSGFHTNQMPISYTEDTYALLEAGRLKLRQRPGKGNALGKVKFIFPNNFNVYLHDTPSQRLFKKPKRDLSHGCIRVEKPTELANFLLRSKTGWNQKKISQTMNLGQPKQVRLKQSVPVIIFYVTAYAEDDKIFFYDDIYGYDTKLNNALMQHHTNQKLP